MNLSDNHIVRAKIRATLYQEKGQREKYDEILVEGMITRRRLGLASDLNTTNQEAQCPLQERQEVIHKSAIHLTNQERDKRLLLHTIVQYRQLILSRVMTVERAIHRHRLGISTTATCFKSTNHSWCNGQDRRLDLKENVVVRRPCHKPFKELRCSQLVQDQTPTSRASLGAFSKVWVVVWEAV